MIIPITNSTKNAPTPTPVLKMPPMVAQLEKVHVKANKKEKVNPLVFMRFLRLKMKLLVDNHKRLCQQNNNYLHQKL